MERMSSSPPPCRGTCSARLVEQDFAAPMCNGALRVRRWRCHGRLVDALHARLIEEAIARGLAAD